MALIDIYFSIISFKIINLPTIQPMCAKLWPYNAKKVRWNFFRKVKLFKYNIFLLNILAKR